jgi:DNA mismatch endonuclease (patch repair protein)
MADVFSKEKRSQVMAAIKSRRNKDTELKLISIFRKNGITGWRRNEKLFGKPDFVFRHERLVVFVDGCFWHGCSKHGRKPTSNSRYWIAKLDRNKKRDRAVSRKLRQTSWKVLRLWEHDLALVKKTAQRVKSILQYRIKN